MKRLLMILFVLLLLPFAANAQTRIEACATDRKVAPSGPYYWPPDSEVKIYLVREMFTPEQRDTIVEAVETWTQAARAAGAGVKFTFAGEGDGIANCEGCLSIKRRELRKYDHEHYAFFYPLNFDPNGFLISAWIDLDFATTDPHAVKGFAAHEIGHSLGLWDCTTCKKKQTIMNGFPGINRDNGLVAPSSSDLEVVKCVYSALRTKASPEGLAATKAGDQRQ